MFSRLNTNFKTKMFKEVWSQIDGHIVWKQLQSLFCLSSFGWIPAKYLDVINVMLCFLENGVSGNKNVCFFFRFLKYDKPWSKLIQMKRKKLIIKHFTKQNNTMSSRSVKVSLTLKKTIRANFFYNLRSMLKTHLCILCV